MITATLRNREEAAIEHYRWKKIALTPTLPALRLQAKTDHYNRSITAKKRINLHYTAGILPGDIPELTRPAKYIQGKRYGPKSVPYLIARIGTILELHDPRFWAYHMGATAIGGNAAMSQAGIGIELSNVGWLTEKQGLMYTYFGQPYCSVEQEDLYVRTPEYRGHTIWATVHVLTRLAAAPEPTIRYPLAHPARGPARPGGLGRHAGARRVLARQLPAGQIRYRRRPGLEQNNLENLLATFKQWNDLCSIVICI
jgi:hypothetical protein